MPSVDLGWWWYRMPKGREATRVDQQRYEYGDSVSLLRTVYIPWYMLDKTAFDN